MLTPASQAQRTGALRGADADALMEEEAGPRPTAKKAPPPRLPLVAGAAPSGTARPPIPSSDELYALWASFYPRPCQAQLAQ